MEEIKDMELLLIGLLLSNYMLIKNQRNNLKKFIIVFLFSNIWGGLNLYSMYEHINGIEKINILCTLLLILVGEYIFYYRYKKGTLKGISKIYFDIITIIPEYNINFKNSNNINYSFPPI